LTLRAKEAPSTEEVARLTIAPFTALTPTRPKRRLSSREARPPFITSSPTPAPLEGLSLRRQSRNSTTLDRFTRAPPAPFPEKVEADTTAAEPPVKLAPSSPFSTNRQPRTSVSWEPTTSSP